MKVRDLIQDFPAHWVEQLTPAVLERDVTAVTSDSRQVSPGVVFVAIDGSASDGHAFVGDAKTRGAALIIGERPLRAVRVTPYLEVEDSRTVLARLASRLHGNPSRQMEMIGVTGTSGKTTTTYLIESILEAAGHRTGVIGTVNFRFGGKVLPSTHTTPGPVELQGILAEMRDHGCTAVVMETSSHALEQERVAYVSFDGTVFTNLTPEHLDFHADMEEYFQAKAKLFIECARYSMATGKRPAAAINVDVPEGVRLAEMVRKEFEKGANIRAYGMSAELPPGILEKVSGSALKLDLSGIRGSAGKVAVVSALTGRFNAENILGAIALAQGLGIPREAIESGISSLKCVPGRLERVSNSQGIHVLVDYAHKPDALEKVLGTLREIRGGHRLITVFGCGGDRDRTKRPVMGRLAVSRSDHAIVTSDNPRTEDPGAIIREILVGTQGASNLSVEADRRTAIHRAIQMAKPGDIVLIAGKGHEDYQIIGDPSAPGGTRKIHFDDREIATEALAGC